MQADADSKTPHIYCANTMGKRFACDLQGKVKVLNAGDPGSMVAFGPLKNNASYAWALLEGRRLTVGDWGSGSGPGFRWEATPGLNWDESMAWICWWWAMTTEYGPTDCDSFIAGILPCPPHL
jgi:hypothetical protein